MCGGTLINRNTILTAAHCTALSSSPSSYTVYLGAQNKYDLNSPDVVKSTVSFVITVRVIINLNKL